jgi:threonine dehydrogenase-like Zn-dependent dehydrogenase
VVKQVRVAEPGALEVVSVPEPRAGRDEVVLAPHSVGICGGDVSLLRGTNAIARYPAVPGHECVAEVVHAPDGELTPGSYVVVYPTFSCGRCRACRAGHLNRCAEMTVFGLSAPGGCLAERFVLPRAQCIPLPDGFGPEYGALVEPVAVSCHVVGRAGVSDGDIALVVGSGTIGIATALVARAHGVERILFADRWPSRSDVLAQLGFPEFTTASEADLAAWVEQRVGRVDLVYDTVTSTDTAAVAAGVLAGGGRYVAIAAAKPGHRVDLRYEHFYARELSLVASRNYRREDFVEAIELIASGEVDPRPLRTSVFGLSEVERGFHELTEHPERTLKVLVTRDELVGSSSLLTGSAR